MKLFVSLVLFAIFAATISAADAEEGDSAALSDSEISDVVMESGEEEEAISLGKRGVNGNGRKDVGRYRRW